MAKIDLTTLKEDLAKRERERQAAEDERLAAQRKARLEKQAQDEIKTRERRIADLEKSKGFIQRQIADLTQGGRISDEKALQDAVDGYNSTIDLQEQLSREAASIAKGDYTVQNGKLTVLSTRPDEGMARAQAGKPVAGKGIKTPKVAEEAAAEETATKTADGKKTKTPVVTAETPVTDKTGKRKKDKTQPQSIQEIYDQVRKLYSNVDSIFLYEPELQQLMRKAVGADGIAGTEDDYTNDRFKAELAATDWAKRGAPVFRQREAEKREYNDQLGKLEKQLELAVDPQKQADIQSKIEELKTQSNYARGLERTKGIVQSIITQVGARYSPEQITLLSQRFYDSANEGDVNKLTNAIAGNIGYSAGAVLGGTSGQYLTELRQTAKANGVDFDKVYGSNVNDWLGKLAQGESVETYKSLIRQQAKLGLPDRIASMLDQGLDLEQIYAPYKNLMASYLEIPAQNIDLNDRTLRMAIGPEKEMTLYDFERSLKNDPRWEYTNNAREEVSSNVLSVLRSFGFQG